MILVADSGSTKCDWMILPKEGDRKLTTTQGLNPLFHSSETMVAVLKNNDELSKVAESIAAVYFYGAACSSDQRNSVVRTSLEAFFPHLETCVVDHDLKAACLATAGTSAGIACILGTGSNACYFDGQTIHEGVPALGYVLGDEGSGSYFGKQLLSNWLYGRLPQVLQSDLAERYDLTKEGVLEAVYKRPNVNVYLASFMPFTSDHKDHPYIREMIYNGLKHFAEIHILSYESHTEVPVHFVGSIAHYFREVLEQVARDLNFTIGKIEQRPIHTLADFHSR